MPKVINVMGGKIGKLNILNDYCIRHNGRSVRKLECLCECGNRCVVDKSKVLRKACKSCGCLQKKMRANFGLKRRKQLGEAMARDTFLQYKKSAKARGYIFQLDEEYFYSLVVEPCHYCGRQGTQIKHRKGTYGDFEYTGIDRIDNRVGYTKDNCVPCCARCNRMKGVLSEEEFIKSINDIYMWRRTA